jgi:hypothetical protein
VARSFSIEVSVDASHAKYPKGSVQALLSLKNGDTKRVPITSTSVTVQLNHPALEAEITWDNDIINQMFSYKRTASQGKYLTAVSVVWGQHTAEKSDEPDGNFAETDLATHLSSETDRDKPEARSHARNVNAMALAFPDVQTILENAVNGDDIGEHGKFWQTTLDNFKALVLFKGTAREKQVLIVGDGINSNLIKALRGQPPFDGTYAARMPDGYNPLPDDIIDQISNWIDAGCP